MAVAYSIEKIFRKLAYVKLLTVSIQLTVSENVFVILSAALVLCVFAQIAD